jgi:cytoskeletal protein CcmA (bactofilin family)
MALWKDQNATTKKDDAVAPQPAPVTRVSDVPAATSIEESRPQSRTARNVESVIAADLNIEGKIQGAGHVRLAGRFNGDVHVEGNLTIDAGAKLSGSVRARTVTVAGDLDGNIESATRVDLLETGVLIGDLKAGALTVAAGSRMRGHVEFGWEEEKRQSVPAAAPAPQPKQHAPQSQTAPRPAKDGAGTT